MSQERATYIEVATYAKACHKRVTDNGVTGQISVTTKLQITMKPIKLKCVTIDIEVVVKLIKVRHDRVTDIEVTSMFTYVTTMQ